MAFSTHLIRLEPRDTRETIIRKINANFNTLSNNTSTANTVSRQGNKTIADRALSKALEVEGRLNQNYYTKSYINTEFGKYYLKTQTYTKEEIDDKIPNHRLPIGTVVFCDKDDTLSFNYGTWIRASTYDTDKLHAYKRTA